MRRILLVSSLLAGAVRPSAQSNLTPELQQHLEDKDRELFESRLQFYHTKLFQETQLQAIYLDSKTFPDATPRSPLEDILKEYATKSAAAGFSLEQFVNEHFITPELVADEKASETQDLETYIETLWPKLVRDFASPQPGSSLISLPYETLVPGGRFREWYYWDSLWPVRFFLRSGDQWKEGIALGMLKNMQSLIDRFGMIPNGNRDYYLGRSQPPIFSMLIQELLDVGKEEEALEMLPSLIKSYAFWARPASNLTELGQLRRFDGGRLRQLKNDPAVSVYVYDAADGDLPRPEAFKEDVQSRKEAAKDRTAPLLDLYRDIQASCEAGWDFTSRFAADCEPTKCLVTTQIAPVDLQAFMWHTTDLIARLMSKSPDYAAEDVKRFEDLAAERKRIVNDYFWDEALGAYTDVFWQTGESTKHVHAAMLIPLALGLAPPDRAEKTLQLVNANLLKVGGLDTSLNRTQHQWDAPFGWAPMQWFYVRAAQKYGHESEARSLMQRWVDLVSSVFRATGRIYEKYNVEDLTAGAGGEYVVQSGFAFTNAVTQEFIHELAKMPAAVPGTPSTAPESPSMVSETHSTPETATRGAGEESVASSTSSEVPGSNRSVAGNLRGSG